MNFLSSMQTYRQWQEMCSAAFSTRGGWRSERAHFKAFSANWRFTRYKGWGESIEHYTRRREQEYYASQAAVYARQQMQCQWR